MDLLFFVEYDGTRKMVKTSPSLLHGIVCELFGFPVGDVDDYTLLEDKSRLKVIIVQQASLQSTLNDTTQNTSEESDIHVEGADISTDESSSNIIEVTILPSR